MKCPGSATLMAAGNVVPIHPEGSPQEDDYRDFLDFFLGERAPSTRVAYLKDLGYLARFLGLPSVNDAVAFLLGSRALEVNLRISDWKQQMLKCLSPATAGRRLATIRGLLHAARSLGLTTVELAVKDTPGGRIKDVRGPDPGTVARMLEILGQDDSPRAKRDLAIAYLATSLALRRQEIRDIDVSDVDLAASKIRIRCKGGQKTTMSLPPQVVDVIGLWLHHRQSLGARSTALFINLASNSKEERLSTTSIYRTIIRAGEQAGSPIPVRPHGLRRAAINEALSIAGLTGASAFARHKDIRSTMEYIDIDEDVQAEISKRLASGLEVVAGTARTNPDSPLVGGVTS